MYPVVAVCNAGSAVQHAGRLGQIGALLGLQACAQLRLEVVGWVQQCTQLAHQG